MISGDGRLFHHLVRNQELAHDQAIHDGPEVNAHVVEGRQRRVLVEEPVDINSQDLGADKRSDEPPLRRRERTLHEVAPEVVPDDVDGSQPPNDGQDV